MAYTIVMKLEQVLPMLRDGKTITRSKKWNPTSTTVILVKIEESSLKFKVIWSTGEEMSFWACYTLKTDDVMAENWEVAE
jgi:hypothetical protein